MITITLTLPELEYLRAALERDMEDAHDIIAFGSDEPNAEHAHEMACAMLKKLPTPGQAIPF
mgnify:CR=1 FL=1